jgi:hypothetical protein
LSHPDFNGNIQWSASDDGNMIAKGIDVFAAGLRNPYSMVLHSNGNLYATGKIMIYSNLLGSSNIIILTILIFLSL